MKEGDKEGVKETNETKRKFSVNLAGIKNIYENQYKKLLIIPFAITILALLSIAIKVAMTGDFMNRDVSLKGGVTITIPTDAEIDANQFQKALQNAFPNNDILVRQLSSIGISKGILIEADVDGTDNAQLDKLLSSIESQKIALEQTDYSIEIIGSSLGESFFRESLIILLVAFLFMGIVVLIYFRNFVPSIAIILAAFSDMVVALAVINLLGIKLGTAGIAAFLMLMGYSVDTDILLTVRVLKRREGTVMDRIYSSIKTGMTETGTAIVAVLVAMTVSQSEVIRQIMLVLFIGLIADIIFTWIQNTGLLRLYLERKERKAEQ